MDFQLRFRQGTPPLSVSLTTVTRLLRALSTLHALLRLGPVLVGPTWWSFLIRCGSGEQGGRHDPCRAFVFSFCKFGWIQHRVLRALPAHGQRSRSNARGVRQLGGWRLRRSLSLIGCAKTSVGQQQGRNLHQKAQRAARKPAKAAKSAKAGGARKKPVVRSRDTKKSIWR